MPRYVLDTNALSDLCAPVPSEKFKNWFIAQERQSLYTTTLNIAELRFGIECLAEGKKRRGLEAWLDNFVLPNFSGRILSFDLASAHIWASLMVRDRKHGQPRPHMDSLLASVAIAHEMVLVTRNIKDFLGLGLRLANPFEDP